MKRFTLLVIVLCCGMWKLAYAQVPTHYQQLYKKAQNWFQTIPDSAIYYAQQALRATSKSVEQAYAHELIAYYSQHIGHYGMAIQHYQQAYKLYQSTSHKAAILNNIAFCYQNSGHYQKAITVASKATQYLSKTGDSTKIMHAYNLLANCYRTNMSYTKADSTYNEALVIAQTLRASKDLANIYDDISRLKERMSNHKEAIHYQKLALKIVQNNKDETKKMIRLAHLVQLCLFVGDTVAANNYMNQANSTQITTPKALVQLYATRGLYYLNTHNEIAAKQAYQTCDSVLSELSKHTNNTLQKKYAHKLGYEVYYRAWWLLDKFWLGNQEKYKTLKEWAEQRMRFEQKLYKEIKTTINAQDSLAIERYRPKVQVIRQVSLWWLLTIALTTIVGGMLIYHKHLQKLRAQTNFIKAIKASPVKGFDTLSQEEVSMLQNIEGYISGKLNADDIKILVMVARSYKYSQISLTVGLQVGTIKSRIKRLKDQCQVDNIRDLM